MHFALSVLLAAAEGHSPGWFSIWALRNRVREDLTEGDALADKRAAVATEQPMLVHPENLAADAVYDPAYAVYSRLYTHDLANALYDVAAGNRPQGPFWPFFSKSSVKQNQHHYTAYCNACTLNGCRIKGTVTGKADSMRPHLASCQFVSAGVRQWAKSYTKDSGPYSEDTAESLDE